MSQISCPSCSFVLPERAIFCPNCASQAKCKNCRDILEEGWRACVSCGTLVGEGELGSEGRSEQEKNTAVNIIEYKETKSKRTFRSAFTDNVGGELTDTLNFILGNRLGSKQVWKQNFPPAQVLDEYKQLGQGKADLIPDQDLEDKTIDVEPMSEESEANFSSLSKIFRQDGSTLILGDQRLKESSNFDFIRRLACLFLYAKEVLGHKQINSEELQTVLRDNAKDETRRRELRRWSSENIDTIVYNDGIGLSEPGKEYARKALKEILNSDVPYYSTKKRSRKKQNNSSTSAKPNKFDGLLKNDSERKTEKARAVSSNKRPGPSEMLDKLVSESFFHIPRTIGEIVTHCEASLACNYKASDFSGALIRFVRDEKLKREKNSDGQYEYTAP